jgi:hypothetical protein
MAIPTWDLVMMLSITCSRNAHTVGKSASGGGTGDRIMEAMRMRPKRIAVARSRQPAHFGVRIFVASCRCPQCERQSLFGKRKKERPILERHFPCEKKYGPTVVRTVAVTNDSKRALLCATSRCYMFPMLHVPHATCSP